MSRTINVGVTVEKRTPVDVLRIAVDISGERDTVQECADAYGETHDRVRDLLVGAGIPATDVRDSELAIRPRIEVLYRKDGRAGYYRATSELRGYSYQGEVVAECDPAPEMVQGAWVVARAFGDGVSFSFDFGLRDIEAAKDGLLAEAVRRGRARADVLAAAACARVEGIAGIDFECGDDRGPWRRFETRCGSLISPDGIGGCPDFNPANVEVKCTVQMRWEIAE